MNKEIILNDVEETNQSISYKHYKITYKGFNVEVERETCYDDDIGEVYDTIEINETEKELTEKDEEIIKDFIEEQE